MTPMVISTSATEIPRRIEMRLAASARPIQAAATNQMLSAMSRSSTTILLPGVPTPRLDPVRSAT